MKFSDITYGLLLFLSGIVLSSCVKEIDRDIETIEFNPTYSLPVGPIDFTMREIMPPEALDLPVIDTSLIPDTIPLIVYDDSLFFINPEWGYDTSFVQVFNLSSLSEWSEYLVYLMIRSQIANSLPSEMGMQIYFIAGANTVLDSLYKEGPRIIQAPESDQEGMIVAPFRIRFEDEFRDEDIDHILQATAIRIYIYVNTYQGAGRVLHVYSWHGVETHIAIRAELTTPL